MKEEIKLLTSKLRLKSDNSFNIKIYQLDLWHYKLRSLTSVDDKIQKIINLHKEKIDQEASYLRPIKVDEINYYSYLYKEKEKDSFWVEFLPKELKENLDFKIDRMSFVLFAHVNNNVFAIIGGGGTRVVKPYLNDRFGIELFERLTEKNSEEIISITYRGISGTLNQSNLIYKEGQRLSDTLEFDSIPTNIVLSLTDYIKDSFFDFIDFEDRNIKLEISSSFFIKQRISFYELHNLFFRIDEILKNRNRLYLTSFVQVTDKKFEDDEYPKLLMKELRDVMVYEFGSDRKRVKKFDIDFVHPSKIKDYYESDKYVIKWKGDHKGIEVNDRSKIFKKGLKYIYDDLGEQVSQGDFNNSMWKLLVLCYKSGKVIKAPFFKYITCELEFNKQPVFQIDGNWYKVKSDFKDRVNELCKGYLEEYCLEDELLEETWGKDVSEGSYNLQYSNRPNYWVLDKCLGDNIELCDIMIETEEKIYLVHVKSGFDAKMRDLSNQIIISAKRLKNSLDSGDFNFINQVIDSYNKKEETKPEIESKLEFFAKFREKKIIYVLAFKSTWKSGEKVKDNIDKANSNIAKYSLIQCVKEMKSSSFQISITEIDNGF
ncbi:DUF6119 family protein [Tenacibaculum crassostreae]|uniref:DUF6119 family protein n=1 Tax=Tenacibaculum crassostreae TaxID=502683 RepID=UPI0038950C8E